MMRGSRASAAAADRPAAAGVGAALRAAGTVRPRALLKPLPPRSGRGAAEAAFAAEMPCRLPLLHLLFRRCTCRSTLSTAAPSAVCTSRPLASPCRKCSPRACSVISACTRVFSFVSTTCEETALSLSMRSVGARRSSTSARTAAVMVIWRPVSSRRMRYRLVAVGSTSAPWPLRQSRAPNLVQNLPLVRRGDLQLLAVLGDGAPRQLETLTLQNLDDLRIAQRLPRIVLFDDLADPLLDGHRRHRFAIRAGDAAVEEVLHLEHALRRVHVLVRHHAADRRLVHADVVGDIAQYERTQVFDPVIEEVALEVDDAGRDLVNRLLPLLDRLDQPQRRAELVLDVGARLVGVFGRPLVEQPPVHRADAQLRQSFLVEDRHVLVFHLDDVDVGNDVLRLRRVVAAARLGIEMANQLDVLFEIVDGHAQLA